MPKKGFTKNQIKNQMMKAEQEKASALSEMAQCEAEWNPTWPQDADVRELFEGWRGVKDVAHLLHAAHYIREKIQEHRKEEAEKRAEEAHHRDGEPVMGPIERPPPAPTPPHGRGFSRGAPI